MDLKSLYKARAVELSASVAPTGEHFGMSVMHDGESVRLLYAWSELCPGKREAYLFGLKAEDAAINARGDNFFKDVKEPEVLPGDEQDKCDERAEAQVKMKFADEMQYHKKKAKVAMPEPPAGPGDGEVWSIEQWQVFNIKMEEYRRIIKEMNELASGNH
jgi:hypothetical protein